MAICYQPCNILSPSSVIKKSLPKPSINVRWNSVEGCAMGKRVMVYKFTGWDTVSQRSIKQPNQIWGTAGGGGGRGGGRGGGAAGEGGGGGGGGGGEGPP